MVDVDLDLELVLDPELVRELLHRGGEALVAEHDRLDVEGEVAKRADRLPVPSSADARIPRAHLRPAVVDRVQRRVEHERDPGEVLHGPVVEEQREPAALVLLGGDDPLDEPRALVVGVRSAAISR